MKRVCVGEMHCVDLHHICNIQYMEKVPNKSTNTFLLEYIEYN